jgi:hypothetical protein
VSHNEKTQTFDFAKKSGGSQIQWAAFYRLRREERRLDERKITYSTYLLQILSLTIIL